MKWYSLGTGIWTTLFSITVILLASAFFWLRPADFTAGNWLSAVGTCAVLFGGVVAKRALDNSKLAKPGVGDNGT